MKYKQPKVIAEIGCNHKGEFDIAIELLNLAKDCGAIVKCKSPKTKLLVPSEF